MLNYLEKFFFNITVSDLAEPWNFFFQDNTTTQMEGLEELHNNIMFYLAIVLFAFLIIVIIPIYIFIGDFLARPYNLTKKAPIAYTFVEIEFKSAIDAIVLGIGGASAFITSIVPRSAYLFSVGIYLSIFFQASPIFIPLLISVMQQIIQNTIGIHAETLAYVLDNISNPEMLREAHAYLTPYLRSYGSIFNVIRRIVMFLERVDSPHFRRVEELEEQYWDIGRNLLDLYRDIETELDISIDESSISNQEW